MRTTCLFLCLLCLAACGGEGTHKLPGVYRIDVQQGNIIEQEMLDKLRPGMDRNQVRFIMGTPAIADPFHADRWEYVFTLSKRGRQREQRHITLFFENDKLAYVDGDVVTALRRPPENGDRRSETIDVSTRQEKPGFFSRLFSGIPFLGDDAANAPPKQSSGHVEAGAETSPSDPVPELGAPAPTP
jgi:outer membrane protein assembly factor BamE